MNTKTPVTARTHRPRAMTVFGAAFVAGAAAAFGVNTVLDAHLAASRPQVESDSILVAIRALPAGSPVTVWDVALKDWPKALVPAAAMRVTDGLDGLVARQPLREGQPILAVHVERVSPQAEPAPRRDIVSSNTASPPPPERDLWAPAETTTVARKISPPPSREQVVATSVAPAVLPPSDPPLEPRPAAPAAASPAVATNSVPAAVDSLATTTDGATGAPPPRESITVSTPASVKPAAPQTSNVATETIPAAEVPAETTPAALVPEAPIAVDEPLSLPAAPPVEIAVTPRTGESGGTPPPARADDDRASVEPRPATPEAAPGPSRRQRPASTRFVDVPPAEAFAVDGTPHDVKPTTARAGRGSAAKDVSVVDRQPGSEADRPAAPKPPSRTARQGDETAKRTPSQAARRPPQPSPRSSGMSRGYRTR